MIHEQWILNLINMKIDGFIKDLLFVSYVSVSHMQSTITQLWIQLSHISWFYEFLFIFDCVWCSHMLITVLSRTHFLTVSHTHPALSCVYLVLASNQWDDTMITTHPPHLTLVELWTPVITGGTQHTGYDAQTLLHHASLNHTSLSIHRLSSCSRLFSTLS